jgi:endonuclease YncB( thermonuclease family)
MRIIAAVAVGMVLGATAWAQEAREPVSGPATVMSTDVIVVDGKRLFLFGIDAFETEQICFLNGRPWACGAIAYRELEIIVAEGDATCEYRVDTDRRRARFPWATCTINGADIAEEMAVRGMALARRDQSQDYIAAEAAAEAAGVGMWQGIFVPPWEFRDNLRGM